MDINTKAVELKNKIMESVQVWSDGLIDSFAESRHMPRQLKKYVKRGIGNILAREDQRITDGINKAMLFIADENGNYDLNMLTDDLISMLREMPETPFDLGLVRGTYGAGNVRFVLPDNMFVSMLMGDTGAIKITESDLQILKEILSENVSSAVGTASQTVLPKK